MKRKREFKTFLLLAFLGFILIACNNDLELNADWKDIPIVYGLLSATSESQYIRVERAFLDPDQPADVIALIPDSLYYADVKVELLNLESNLRFELMKVFGEDEGLPRNEGAFAEIPNILYKIDTKTLGIKPGDSYELNIIRNETSPIITAETQIVDTVRITQPGDRINFDEIAKFRVQWFPISNKLPPSLYDVSMRINYRELNQSIEDPEWEEKSVTWKVGSGIEETELLTAGKEFYVFLANNIEEKTNHVRDFLGIDVVVDAGGQEIVDYLRVGQANLGITASQEIPVYSNLSEGRGIFSSRNRSIKERILLSSLSQDSLKEGQFTRHLNFID